MNAAHTRVQHRGKHRTIVLAAALTACVDELPTPDQPPVLPFEHTSEHFDVHADIERCAGDLARWDEFTEFAAALLDAPLPTAQPLYTWEIANFDGVAICGFSTSGCYRESEGIIYASTPTVEHEIIHVLTQDYESPDSFFREGLAEALSGPTAFGRFTPSFPRSGSEQVDYASAGHFVRWLIESRGLELVLAQLGSDGSVASFEQLAGQPLDAVAEAYFTEAPLRYPALHRQSLPSLELTDVGVWSTNIEISCASEDVRATLEGPEVWREWTLAAPGHYAFWTTPPSRIRIRLESLVDPGDTETWLDFNITLRGEDMATATFPAGVYELAILPPASVSEMQLFVWANPASVPTAPGASP